MLIVLVLASRFLDDCHFGYITKLEKKPKKGHCREAGETACLVPLWKPAFKKHLYRIFFPK
jgi:hypothetical protein